jgi:pimeloyl-ACP methyl ester carboxylesterase
LTHIPIRRRWNFVHRVLVGRSAIQELRGKKAATENCDCPKMVTDGRSDVIDPPKNSLMIANQIPSAWLAFFEGGHSFLFKSHQQFAATVNAFLQ